MLNKKSINSYQINGELKIKNLLSDAEIFKIKKELQSFLINNKKNLILAKNFNYLKNSNKISSLHRLEKYKKLYFFKISNKKKFKNLAESLIGSQAKLLSVQFFFKKKGENKATPPHQDNAYWCYKNGNGLSFWITLNSTNKKNGSLYYYQGSHKKDLKHFPSSNTPGSSQILKKIDKKYIRKSYSLKRGDGVAHDSRIIHGSTNNITNKNRSAFVISYVSVNSAKDKKKQKSYEKKLISSNKNRQRKMLQ